MTAPRFMTSIFCDDVRQEQGNKLSFMGIYNGTMQTPAFPLILPKLCVVMNVYCPGAGDPPRVITFNLYRNDDLLHEIPMEIPNALEALGEGNTIADDKILTFTTIMQLFPFHTTEPCELKARAVCDGVELKGGRLALAAAPVS